MLKKIAATAVLAATAFLGATPALADHDRYGRFDKRMVAGDTRAPFYGHGERRVVERRYVEHRPVVVRRHVVHRPVVVHRYVAPPPPAAVVYHHSHSHDVLGGLIFGAVLGAAIASAGH